MTRTIGQGAFGTVKLARNKTTNQIVAIKKLKKCEIVKNKQVDHVHDELTLISNMNHQFLVKLEGFT
jgi:serine/threonine protein kinase